MQLFFRRFLILSLTGCLIIITSFQAMASEYKVEIFNHLCREADDPARYTSGKLKALQYLTEGKNGWLFRSHDDFLNNFDERASYSGLRSLTQYLSSKGTRLLLLYLPTRGLMNPDFAPPDRFNYQAARASYLAKITKLRSLGILVPDMELLLSRYQNTDFYFKRDIHWTPNGARLAAHLVADTIQKAGIHLLQATQNTVNNPIGPYAIHGFMHQATQQLCGGRYVYQFVEGYEYDNVDKADSNDTHDNLLSEESDSDTVLLGTSFSAVEPLNFIGFLQEYSGTTIDNYSIPSGRDLGAWLKYIASGDFAAHPPKIIIWEVPGYYLLDDPMLFAQLMPSIQGGCAERNPLVDKETNLAQNNANNNALFFTDKILDIPLSELVMDLDFTDKEINEIKINIWYKNGKVKKGKIRKPSRAETGGRFIFSLFGDMLEVNSGVMSVQLTKIEGKPISEYLEETGQRELKVHVKVCRLPSLSIGN